MADYSILVGLIALAAIGAVVSTGDEVADVFCEASDLMTDVPGIERQERCINNPNDRINLAPDERFMDPKTPLQMQGEFSDVLFEKDETGERLIFSEFVEAPAASFWLDTALSSRNPHDANRLISSCYILGGGVDPICGAAGISSAVTVPAAATAMGYAVSLSDNLQMPWQNDVAISIPAGEGVEGQSWNIEVARVESDPVIKDVSVAFSSHTFEKSDEGWSFGTFAPINGEFNQPLQFKMDNISGPDYSRRACYVPSEGADPICGSNTDSSNEARLEIAPGAVSVGYEISLPAENPGPDWVAEEKLTLEYGANIFGDDDITITRPNDDYMPGALAGTFSNPHMFADTDTDVTAAEFIDFDGERNVSLNWKVGDSNGHNYQRAACYKLADGTEECSDLEQYGDAEITVPITAVSVGYKIKLPAEAVGPDFSIVNRLSLQGGNATLVDADFEAIRPNEPYAPGGLSGSFSSPYMFANTDTGVTAAEFIDFDGERNVSLLWTVRDSNDHELQRAACYKLGDGTEECSDLEQYGDAEITVPITAVSVGYKIKLPAEAVGPDFSIVNRLSLQGGNATLVDADFEAIRPNEPYAPGGLSGSFSDPYTFAQSDTGVTVGEFIDLSGPRNINLTWKVAKVDNHGHKRYACYKLSDETEVCSNGEWYYEAEISVPPEAVSVGYKLNLPAPNVGPATTFVNRLSLLGGGATHVSGDYEVIRPNEGYQTGSLEKDFDSPYMFRQSDTGQTITEYIALSGPRNVNLTWSVREDDDRHSRRRLACYKLEDGHEECSTASAYTTTISVPPSAVSVGYKIELPGSGVGPDTEYNTYLQLIGGGATHVSGNYTAIRPNEPYATGSLARDFQDPYVFDSSATGLTEVEFIPLSGPRNVNLTFRVSRVDKHSYQRSACYRLADGAEECSSPSGYYATEISVPPEAVSVGYKVGLPPQSIGPSTSFENRLELLGGGANHVSNNYEIVRENTPYQTGSMSNSFQDPYMFNQTDTGETLAEYVAFDGPRNVNYRLRTFAMENQEYKRASCYKLADGHEECSDFTQGYADITVPPEAVAVGYKISLPPTSTGADTLMRTFISMYGFNDTHVHGNYNAIRPNGS